MLNLIKKNLNSCYVLSALCALISLLPVFKYSFSAPGDLILTLVIWLLSNLVISTFFFYYNRNDRLFKRLLSRKSNVKSHEDHMARRAIS